MRPQTESGSGAGEYAVSTASGRRPTATSGVQRKARHIPRNWPYVNQFGFIIVSLARVQSRGVTMKRFGLFCAAMCLVAAFATACGGSNTSTQEPETGTATATASPTAGQSSGPAAAA